MPSEDKKKIFQLVTDHLNFSFTLNYMYAPNFENIGAVYYFWLVCVCVRVCELVFYATCIF